jgi:CNP1-like family
MQSGVMQSTRGCLVLSWLLLFTLLSACGSTRRAEIDREPLIIDADVPTPRVEPEVVFPGAPQATDLVLVRREATSGYDYLIDGRSITVDRDSIVRFVMIARSSAGADNVTYEAIRCPTRESRVYGFGRADGSWSRSRNVTWRRLPPLNGPDIRVELFRDVFCAGGSAIANATAAVAVMRARQPGR